MKDVADAAGVSVMTVSRAFREDASISDKTRAKIREAADRLGYVFDNTAASFRTKRTGFVAVIIPSINNANFAETVRGLSDVLSENGYQVLLGYTNYKADREEELVEQFLSRRPDAIVLTGGAHTERAQNLLRNAAIPIVETWDMPSAPMGHVVGFSNENAMQALVGHLVETGARRIAFIGGDAAEDPRGRSRRRGFLEAMKHFDLEPSRLIDAGEPPISMTEGAQAMEVLLDTYPDTDAVACVSDLCAFGALSTTMRRGLKVPDDLLLAGFGAYEIASVAVPSLTTIDAFPRVIGKQAAQIILETSTTNGASEAPVSKMKIEIEPELRLGRSTARDQ